MTPEDAEVQPEAEQPEEVAAVAIEEEPAPEPVVNFVGGPASVDEPAETEVLPIARFDPKHLDVFEVCAVPGCEEKDDRLVYAGAHRLTLCEAHRNDAGLLEALGA